MKVSEEIIMPEGVRADYAILGRVYVNAVGLGRKYWLCTEQSGKKFMVCLGTGRTKHDNTAIYTPVEAELIVKVPTRG